MQGEDGCRSDSQSAARRSSICFVATNPGLTHLLTGRTGSYLGGIELQVSLLARALLNRAWQVSFVVADEGQEDVVEAQGIRLISGCAYRESKLPWFVWHIGRQLEQALANAQAETYVLQGASWQALAIARYCTSESARSVFWLASNTDPVCHIRGRSRLPWWQRAMAHRGMQLCDAIVAQTNYQADLVHEHLRRESTVIRNVWPYEIAVRPHPATPMVLWVANMRAVKRPEMALEIARRAPEISFIMVGGAVRKHERYYRQVIQQAEAIPNLTCTGFLPFAEADRLFEQATVFLNTSAVEGFPNTYLQAWSRGVPVVGSFDPDEAICRHGLGVHFRAVDEAVEAIRTLCNAEATMLQALGERATQYIRENHSTDVVVGQLEALLESLQCAT